jgi:hypothetical protein
VLKASNSSEATGLIGYWSPSRAEFVMLPSYPRAAPRREVF